MPVVISTDSALGKELARWNTPRNRPVLDSSGDPCLDTDGTTLMGKGAIGYEPYPKMLYKAQTHPISGQIRCMSPEPDSLDYSTTNEYERALNQIIRFNAACSRIVRSEEEHRRAMSDGWTESPTDAIAAAEAREIHISELAAERHFKDRTMSAAAQAEAAEADASTSKHVVDVVGTSKRTRGRPRKATAVTA